MSQTERLYHIDKLLRANRCVPVRRFLEELGISIATFKRDLEHLRNNLNAPIEWDRACGGYRFSETSSIGPRFELPGVWFNASEIHALLTIEHLLKDIEPGHFHPIFDQLRDRLATTLGRSEASVREISRRIFVRPRFKRPTSPRFFETVVDALLRRRRLHVLHDSRFTGRSTERDVSPQRLIHYREIWYLVGWCHLRQAVRTFALDNLKAVRALDDVARDVDDTELDILLNTGYGIWSGSAVNWAKLRFHPVAARWAACETWHPDQRAAFEADGGYLLEIPYTQDDELIMDLLRYGPGCTVLAPEALKNKLIQRLREALDNYNNT